MLHAWMHSWPWSRKELKRKINILDSRGRKSRLRFLKSWNLWMAIRESVWGPKLGPSFSSSLAFFWSGNVWWSRRVKLSIYNREQLRCKKKKKGGRGESFWFNYPPRQTGRRVADRFFDSKKISHLLKLARLALNKRQFWLVLRPFCQQKIQISFTHNSDAQNEHHF